MEARIILFTHPLARPPLAGHDDTTGTTDDPAVFDYDKLLSAAAEGARACLCASADIPHCRVAYSGQSESSFWTGLMRVHMLAIVGAQRLEEVDSVWGDGRRT